MFSEEELSSIKAHNLEPKDVENQVQKFVDGFKPLHIVAPATAKNGIKCLSDERRIEYVKTFENATEVRKLKFVPASGAATRMFKALFEAMNSGKTSAAVDEFCNRIKDFALYDDLQEALKKDNTSIEELLEKKDITTLLSYVLTDKGLNYGSLPKGLLRFHRTPNGCATPFEEHMKEGIVYGQTNGVVRMHYTVSDAHKDLFAIELKKMLDKYKELYKCQFEVEFSVQKPETDTIAVDESNNPVKAKNGGLLFRPGGHGALIANLNQINSDIIFIKNIDNVVQDEMRADTYTYKKALGGMLITYKRQIDQYLTKLDSRPVSINLMHEVESFIKDKLMVVLPEEYDNYTESQKICFLRGKLDRPIRICGMVVNEGEPGGGPFWVRSADGSVQLQILESTQIPESKKDLMAQSTHFNPVDLVCSTVDYRGNKYDLTHFIDHNTGFISSKSVEGRAIKALELPGLWNGAMSDWTTLFVEVPASTFNPVKTVNDLLRKPHMPQC